MNRLMMIAFLAIGIAFAVKPVPRTADVNKNDKPATTVQVQKDEDRAVENNAENVMTKNDRDKNKDKAQVKNKTPASKDDKIIDVDSNNVNDQRENDLLKIKQLKSKFLQDLLKKIPAGNDDNEEQKKPSRPATLPKKKKR